MREPAINVWVCPQCNWVYLNDGLLWSSAQFPGLAHEGQQTIAWMERPEFATRYADCESIVRLMH